MNINMSLIFQIQESSWAWPSDSNRLKILSPKMYVCAYIFGMLIGATARNVPNDTNFDAILSRAAHGTLEVKYLQHFHCLCIYC
jgi:hypothetical protein